MIQEYMLKRGTRPSIPAFDLHEIKWEAPLDVFVQSLERERRFLQNFHEYINLSREENDEATVSFLLKMVDHQVDCIDQFDKLHDQAKAYAQLPALFYHLDHELR